MGKKRIAVIGTQPEPKPKKAAQSRPIAPSGKGQTGRLTDMGAKMLKEAEKVKPSVPSPATAGSVPSVTKKPIRKRARSRKYRLARTQIDKTKSYPLTEAVVLAKRSSISRFDGNLEAHLNLTQSNLRLTVSFPYSTGSRQKVAIASEALLNQLDQGVVDFNILLSTPEFMPKLLKYAKILGPHGLLPNPKTGTITPDPAKTKQELESGTLQVKSEAKAPLMHLVLGQLSQPDEQLVANLKALIQAVTPKRILKLTLAPTMGPSLKVDFSLP